MRISWEATDILPFSRHAIFPISATESARSLSAVPEQVQNCDMAISIKRSTKAVARLVPLATPVGFPLADLNRLFVGLPHLGSAEASRWRAEVRAMRRARRPQIRNWA